MKVGAFLLLLAAAGVVRGENAKDPSVVKDTIVIQTPLQNYEKPSLRDYEECQSNRRSCLNICDGREKCELECPLCPELTEEPLLVHGINDTSYVAPAQSALNTTNIIKLTNEITNIIKNDIQGRNEINVQVHQNVSMVGGQFGLGYNERGSCCHVVQRERSCDHLENCQEHSRHRVCGAQCQARVMHAKRRVLCEKDHPDECRETVEYVPMHHRKSKSHTSVRHFPKYQPQTQSNECEYINNWPFVSCSQTGNIARMRRASCQKCLSLTYGYVVQNGIPPDCTGCFPGYMPLIPQPVLYANYLPPRFDYNYPPQPQPQPDVDDQNTYQKEEEQEQKHQQDTDLDIGDSNSDSDWVLKSEKCLDSNEELVDCNDGKLPPAHLEQDQDNDPYYDVQAQRRRRRHGNFMRSLYSRRV